MYRNITPRPSITVAEKPMVLWNLVPEATSYIFKIVEKETSDIIWEEEVTEIILVTPEQFASDKSEDSYKPPQCKTDGNYCVCDYPSNEKPLKRLIPYLFTGTAKGNNGSLLKEFQTELFLIEQETEEAVQELQNQITILGESKLTQYWFRTKELISISGGITLLAKSTDIPPWIKPCTSAVFR